MGKLQITPLKFRVVWILHPKILKFDFIHIDMFYFCQIRPKIVKNNGRLGTIETVQFCPNLKHKT